MKRNHYLSRREQDAVGSKFGRDKLYLHLRSLALQADAEAEYFSLSGEDLLYHATYSLDTMLELLVESEEEAVLYCRDLWQELRMHFAERVECGESDRRRAATLVVGTLANLLFIGNRARYWRQCDALVMGAREGDVEMRERMELVLTDVLYRDTVAHDLEVWMLQYAMADVCMSDEIAALVEKVRSTADLDGIDNQEEIIDKLKTYFWDDRDKAEAFIYKIHGKDDMMVIETIAEMANHKPKQILCKQKKGLWTILHDHGLYNASSVNFSNLLKQRGY